MERPRVTEQARKILKLLPALLREDAMLRSRLRRILAEDLATKDDIKRILDRMDASDRRADRRFETSERRFEAIDRRFETSERRFETIERRFEAGDRRFDAALKELREFKAETQQRFEDQQDWVGIVVGGFQRRAGRSLEQTIAGTLRIALKMKDVDPARITMRRKVVDATGRIGPAGRSYELDIVATNGENWIFEIKSVPDEEDVERFNDKAELAISALALPGARKALITLDKSPPVTDTCRRLGIELG
jgi:hypothetical protein